MEDVSDETPFEMMPLKPATNLVEANHRLRAYHTRLVQFAGKMDACAGSISELEERLAASLRALEASYRHIDKLGTVIEKAAAHTATLPARMRRAQFISATLGALSMLAGIMTSPFLDVLLRRLWR